MGAASKQLQSVRHLDGATLMIPTRAATLAVVTAVTALILTGCAEQTQSSLSEPAAAGTTSIAVPIEVKTSAEGDLNFGSNVFASATEQPVAGAAVPEVVARASFDALRFEPYLIPGSPQVSLRLVHGQGVWGYPTDPTDRSYEKTRLAWLYVWPDSTPDVHGAMLPTSSAEASAASNVSCMFVAVVAADVPGAVLNTHQSCGQM